MRLIDIDAITDEDIRFALNAVSSLEDVRAMLSEQPIAYDVDAVINELIREKIVDSEVILSDVHQGYNAGLSRAIDIVKGGGTDD